MIRIGIIGYHHFDDTSTMSWVRTAIDLVLGEHLDEIIGVSCLVTRIDQVFATLVLERRGALEVVVPFPDDRVHWLSTDVGRAHYDQLMGRARIEVLPREARSNEEACLQAGIEIVTRCDLLMAVWNEVCDGGPGRTTDIVAHARARERAMVIIDPLQRTLTRAGAAAQPAPMSQLADRELNVARQLGDPIVDPIVSEHATLHGADAVRAVTGALFHASGLPDDSPLVRAYVEALGDVDLGDPEIIARGQRLFALFGPEILLVLGSCSLPLAFAAGNGVQAIYRARRLNDDPLRRLYDTAQMVINVMQVWELARGRIGWRTARKVRLIHGLIRWHVQRNVAVPWSSDWGVPINQEDLAGTLLSFSVAVLHGLRTMGARISTQDADAYVYAWSAVGRLLGIDEALLSTREDEALLLATRIGKRQIRATPEGKLLAEQLMAAVATLLPVPGYANSLTHYFLRDAAFGRDVARVLELPAPSWTRALVAARAWQKRKLLRLLDIVPGARRRRSFLARRFVQNLILARRPDGAPPFEVPVGLAKRWRVATGPRNGDAAGERNRCEARMEAGAR